MEMFHKNAKTSEMNSEIDCFNLTVWKLSKWDLKQIFDTYLCPSFFTKSILRAKAIKHYGDNWSKFWAKNKWKHLHTTTIVVAILKTNGDNCLKKVEIIS